MTVPEGTDLDAREGADAPAPPRARAGRQRRRWSCAASSPSRTSSSRPSTRSRARTSSAACAWAPPSARRGDTEERVEALVAAGVDVHRRRHVARAFAGRARSRAVGQEAAIRRCRSIGGNVATADGAQGARRSRRRRGEGRHRSRLDLHDAHRRRRRRAADLGDPVRARRRRRSAAFRSIADGGIRYSGDIAKALAAGRVVR